MGYLLRKEKDMENWLGYSKYLGKFQYYDTDSVKEVYNSENSHALKITCEFPKEGEVIVSKDKERCLYDELAGLL